jgi:hypothetical protein
MLVCSILSYAAIYPSFFEVCGHFSTLDLTWTARTPSRLVLILLHLVHAPHIGRLCPCALEPAGSGGGGVGELRHAGAVCHRLGAASRSAAPTLLACTVDRGAALALAPVAPKATTAKETSAHERSSQQTVQSLSHRDDSHSPSTSPRSYGYIRPESSYRVSRIYTY